MSILVRNKYKLMNIIGEGKFGVVYEALDIENEKKVAIKFDSSNIGLLRHEATVLNFLTSKKCQNIPLIYWYGMYGNNSVPCIVIPLYKCSLCEYINHNNRSFIQNKNIFVNMLSIIKTIHNLSVIHRDIKPDNFMLNDKEQLVLIDFGLSSFFSENDNETTEHFTGNVIYASPNIHNLKIAKVVDDIISILYVYMFICFDGKLPWINIDDNISLNDTKINRIKMSKNIENIELYVSSNTSKVDERLTKYMRKLYAGIICYSL